jgi:hypothetical protein
MIVIRRFRGDLDRWRRCSLVHTFDQFPALKNTRGRRCRVVRDLHKILLSTVVGTGTSKPSTMPRICWIYVWSTPLARPCSHASLPANECCPTMHEPANQNSKSRQPLFLVSGSKLYNISLIMIMLLSLDLSVDRRENIILSEPINNVQQVRRTVDVMCIVKWYANRSRATSDMHACHDSLVCQQSISNTSTASVGVLSYAILWKIVNSMATELRGEYNEQMPS